MRVAGGELDGEQTESTRPLRPEVQRLVQLVLPNESRLCVSVLFLVNSFVEMLALQKLKWLTDNCKDNWFIIKVMIPLPTSSLSTPAFVPPFPPSFSSSLLKRFIHPTPHSTPPPLAYPLALSLLPMTPSFPPNTHTFPLSPPLPLVIHPTPHSTPTPLSPHSIPPPHYPNFSSLSPYLPLPFTHPPTPLLIHK